MLQTHAAISEAYDKKNSESVTGPQDGDSVDDDVTNLFIAQKELYNATVNAFSCL